jgi:hypothetical protein
MDQRRYSITLWILLFLTYSVSLAIFRELNLQGRSYIALRPLLDPKEAAHAYSVIERNDHIHIALIVQSALLALIAYIMMKVFANGRALWGAMLVFAIGVTIVVSVWFFS